MSYQEDLILSMYNQGEPGLAMGNIPPGKGGAPGQPYDAPKEDPKNPYVPAPKRDLAMDDELSEFDLTEKGLYMNYMGDMFMNLDGMLFPMGQGYDEGTHGKLVPKGLVQSMQINPDVAMFPRLSTGEPMTNMEKKQGLDVLRKTRDPEQIKRFVQQMMRGV